MSLGHLALEFPIASGYYLNENNDSSKLPAQTQMNLVPLKSLVELHFYEYSYNARLYILKEL